ncbi:hypothetical protein [Gordonia phthalatica]|uniref:Uncharacterized protein n=1 Tax=Gordonia phthalatica TaxID=1136941 RepID=A0A0N9N6Q0_9ACTN|nr:hypothetical protein [Gordonia phthalatica]ALG83538.1 hypothetical protein ACH46_02220 [Gordonia phthalatica]
MPSTPFRDRLRGVVARLPDGVGRHVPLAIRIVKVLAAGNISDRSMTLAAQAFTSILPVLLLLTTMPGSGALDRTIAMFDLSQGLGPTDSPGTYASFGVIGALMTLISATSMARALDRMYVGVWGVDSAGLRGWWRWVLVIAVLAVATLGQAMVVVDFNESDGRIILSLAETFLIWTCAWTAVPRILTRRQLGRADLWWLGAASGAGLTAFIVVTEIGYARVFATARHQFGALGVVFASIGWLFVFTAIVVIVTLLVQVLRTPAAADAGSGQASG